ncbi:Serine/threonine-protein kinase, active site [Sesbania bispinosa]|nr:Serine/threonine-protein kinase, active site [Sesbania bispinosa]
MEPGKKGGGIGSELMANKVTGGDVRNTEEVAAMVGVGAFADAAATQEDAYSPPPPSIITLLPTSAKNTQLRASSHCSATMHGALLSAANAATVVASAVENDHCATYPSSTTAQAVGVHGRISGRETHLTGATAGRDSADPARTGVPTPTVVVHRDIKSPNLLINSRKQVKRIRDFGV